MLENVLIIHLGQSTSAIWGVEDFIVENWKVQSKSQPENILKCKTLCSGKNSKGYVFWVDLKSVFIKHIYFDNLTAVQDGKLDSG